jgi:hypothetical protein
MVRGVFTIQHVDTSDAAVRRERRGSGRRADCSVRGHMKGPLIVSLVSIILAVGGTSACVTTQVVTRPPALSDIARINAAAAQSGSMEISCISSNAFCEGPACSPEGSATGGYVLTDVTRIESLDASSASVHGTSGVVHLIPWSEITAIGVRNRVSGAALGVLAGAALGLAISLPFAALAESGPGPDAPITANSPCNCLGKTLFAFTVSGAIVGGVIGYVAGTRRRYQLGDYIRASRFER